MMGDGSGGVTKTMPGRRRAALHAIRLAAMRLDREVPAEAFAREIEDLIEAVREQTVLENVAALASIAEKKPQLSGPKRKVQVDELMRELGMDPGEFLRDLPARPEPIASEVQPPAASEGWAPPDSPVFKPPAAPAAPTAPPSGGRRRGGIPKLSDAQKAELERDYRVAMYDRTSTPFGWIPKRAAALGVGVNVVYNALADVRTELLTAGQMVRRGRPPTREVQGTYGATARRERGPMA